MSYASGGSIPGVGAAADASFETAGATFMTSLAGLAVILAGVGPSALLLSGARWGCAGCCAAMRSTPPPPSFPGATGIRRGRNVVQRWFGREHQQEPEHVE